MAKKAWRMARKERRKAEREYGQDSGYAYEQEKSYSKEASTSIWGLYYTNGKGEDGTKGDYVEFPIVDFRSWWSREIISSVHKVRWLIVCIGWYVCGHDPKPLPANLCSGTATLGIYENGNNRKSKCCPKRDVCGFGICLGWVCLLVFVGF